MATRNKKAGKIKPKKIKKKVKIIKKTEVKKITKKKGFFESLFGIPKENKVRIKRKAVSKKLIKKSKLKAIRLKEIKKAKLEKARKLARLKAIKLEKIKKAKELKTAKIKAKKEAKLKADKIKAMEKARKLARLKAIKKAKLEKLNELKAAKLKKQKEEMLKAKLKIKKTKPKTIKKPEVKLVKPEKVGFFDSLFGIFKEEDHIKKEIKKLKENGKIKDKFEEEYEDYVKRKERERNEPEHEKLKKMPTAKEIKKRALPVALKHEKTLMKELKKKKIKAEASEWIKTGVSGFDDLFENGVPKGSAVLVAGGAGSGKTIFCLQTVVHNALLGKKCFYMSFEESEERLMHHMKDFGWDAEKLIQSGKLKIQRMSPFEITRNVDAMLAKEKGELLIDIDPVILPEGFKPDIIVLDSLTAVASAFTGKEDSYRIYIEQLFRFFEKMESTSLLVTETKQIPDIFSTTGVEEFLADGVIVFYNIKRGNIKESAIEVLKMRGEKHQKKIVAMQITSKGIVVYPEQEVFGGLKES
jgi:KaiC/GvpD/RAD55 family RecA-like ATPase